MALNIVLKCHLVFLRAKSLGCALEKIHVMDQLRAGVSYSGIDHEFSVNESAMYIK